ncbi:5-hydroxytryptamine receptor 1-like [Pecten maximus]|uniref:5-hydroxytryptamine receptor 1-like n=1 Tax=Pecten maximus TaxID=6579 RepID=UPI001457F288|nr:5-hydroxytryptamine receptor 1-like [Pecten maximus]
MAEVNITEAYKAVDEMVDLRTTVEIVFSAICLLTLIIASVFGNIAVIIAVVVNRNLREAQASFLIVNLAVTDLINGLTVMVSSFCSMVADHWVFGDAMCSIVCAINYCLIITSMLTLCFISFDRYQAVLHPMKYPMWISRNKVCMAIAYSWIQGVVFSVVPVILQWIQYDYWEAVCAIQWQQEKKQAVYYVVTAFLLCFFLPGLALVVNYFLVVREVRRASRLIQPFNERLASRKSNYSQSSKVVNSLLVVVMAYFVCMTPFSVTKLIKVIVTDTSFVPGRINTLASLVGYCSSAVNPLVYGLLRKDFKSSYKLILKKILHPTLKVTTQNDTSF